MKKKVFFIISSLNAGGAEKVFWLLSQYFDKKLYDVSIVVLNGERNFFSVESDIRMINLNTRKSSLSFFKLLRLLKNERPDAIYTTGGQINALIGLLSFFIDTPKLIARPANVANVTFESIKSKLIGLLLTIFYRRFDRIVCQSQEIETSVLKNYKIDKSKMVIIPNPVLSIKENREHESKQSQKRIITVGRLAKQKGHERLLDIVKLLPENYLLTIAGDGILRERIAEKIKSLRLEDRVHMIGLVTGVPAIIARHDLFVLPSFFEGFPNAVIESLSVGTPVVAFRVGGISAMIKNDFNGYIVEQEDLQGFRETINKALNKDWDHHAIREDIVQRFSIASIVNQYQKLIA